jgi:hypothetical protein
MKRTEPTVNILHRNPGQYKPSFLMVWKPTTIPRLNGAYGLQGYWCPSRSLVIRVVVVMIRTIFGICLVLSISQFVELTTVWQGMALGFLCYTLAAVLAHFLDLPN